MGVFTGGVGRDLGRTLRAQTDRCWVLIKLKSDLPNSRRSFSCLKTCFLIKIFFSLSLISSPSQSELIKELLKMLQATKIYSYFQFVRIHFFDSVPLCSKINIFTTNKFKKLVYYSIQRLIKIEDSLDSQIKQLTGSMYIFRQIIPPSGVTIDCRLLNLVNPRFSLSYHLELTPKSYELMLWVLEEW
jgi:hypothetical protein